MFSVHTTRPCLHAFECCLELDYRDVVEHTTLNRVVQVLYRKRQGSAPCSAEPLDIPAQYLIERVNGATKWDPWQSP